MLSSFWRCCHHLPQHRNSLDALSYNTIQRAEKVLRSHDISSHVDTRHVFSRREQQLAARKINNERTLEGELLVVVSSEVNPDHNLKSRDSGIPTKINPSTRKNNV